MTPRKLFLAILFVGLAGAAPATAADVHYDLDTDFSKFETYSWFEPEPPRIPDIRDYLKKQVGGYLRAAGMREVESGGDLDVVIHVVSSSSASTVGAYIHLVTWDAGLLVSSVTSSSEATLIIDMVDTAANKSVWVGRANHSFTGVAQYQKIRNKVDRVTKKMFKKFPPKLR